MVMIPVTCPVCGGINISKNGKGANDARWCAKIVETLKSKPWGYISNPPSFLERKEAKELYQKTPFNIFKTPPEKEGVSLNQYALYKLSQ